jgi:hypothetical protein
MESLADLFEPLNKSAETLFPILLNTSPAEAKVGTVEDALLSRQKEDVYRCLLYDKRGFKTGETEFKPELSRFQAEIISLPQDHTSKIEKMFDLGSLWKVTFGYAILPVRYDLHFGQTLDECLHLHAESSDGQFNGYTLAQIVKGPAVKQWQNSLVWFSDKIEVSDLSKNEFYSYKNGELLVQKGQPGCESEKLLDKFKVDAADLLKALKQYGVTVFVLHKPDSTEFYAQKEISRYLHQEFKVWGESPPKLNTELIHVKVSDVRKELETALAKVQEVYKNLS